ncbi:TPA: hypothetical protein MYQ10_005081 [Citrobacter amalonaticus]|nr:hypothetical protein [Citrobacter amalonaticus]
MALRIRDKKERVNLFLEYFDCTYEVKPRTPFNQPDVLTMNFYYALKLFCKNYNEIYDAPHHWKDKIPALFTGYKMLFESEELKVSFICGTMAKKARIMEKYHVSHAVTFRVPYHWNGSREPVGIATYHLAIDKTLNDEQIEQEFYKLLTLFEYSLKYHQGKVPVFKIDLNNPEVIRPKYEKE